MVIFSVMHFIHESQLSSLTLIACHKSPMGLKGFTDGIFLWDPVQQAAPGQVQTNHTSIIFLLAPQFHPLW